MGGCQNYGPLLGTLTIRCRIIIRTQKGTLRLTTTHMVEQGRYGLELLGLYGFTSFFVVSGSCFRPLGLGQISPEAEELIYI